MRGSLSTFGLLLGLASAAAAGPLAEPGDIAGAGDALILDIRAPAAFAAGHVPGAVNTPYAAFRGPDDNPGRVPSETDLEALLGAAGATLDRPVIVVHEGKDATDFGAAARVYWTLKSSGFADLSILNGGYNAWVAAGNAPSTQPASVTPTVVDISFSDEWMIDSAGVKAAIDGSSPAVLLDARPADFFTGKTKHKAAQSAGTLAGALNLVHATWFREEGPVVAADAGALERLRQVASAQGDAPLVSFCNTGHWAATNWFAASELAGIEGVKLYPESMVGWTLLGNPTVVGTN